MVPGAPLENAEAQQAFAPALVAEPKSVTDILSLVELRFGKKIKSKLRGKICSKPSIPTPKTLRRSCCLPMWEIGPESQRPPSYREVLGSTESIFWL